MGIIFGRRNEEPENLHPELEGARVTEEGVSYLRHPACCEKYSSRRNHHYNQRLAEWTERCLKAQAQKDWDGYLHCHEKRYWPEALTKIKGAMPLAVWAQLVRTAWVLSDEFWNIQEKWRVLLANRVDFPGFMTDAELGILARLPDPLTVYRGGRIESVAGLSWTTKLEIADYFEYQIKPRGTAMVVEGLIAKVDVFAFIDKDEESEIIAFPERIVEQRVIKKAGTWLDD